MTLLFRSLFGLLFLATSTAKLLDNRGFAEILSTYRLFPEQGLLFTALAFALAEGALSLALLRGRRSIQTAWIVLSVHLTYLVVTAITYFRGIRLQNCGCFGVFYPRTLTSGTLMEDTVLLVLSAAFIVAAILEGRRQRAQEFLQEVPSRLKKAG